MNTAAQTCTRFEFSFPKTDTLLLVEVHENTVLVRATEPSFGPAQKTAFIQHLIAEGFIPAHIRNEVSPEPLAGGVQWAIDDRWLDLSETLAAKTRRVMASVLCGSGLLWVGFVTFLFLRE
jgi:hypothetical protein